MNEITCKAKRNVNEDFYFDGSAKLVWRHIITHVCCPPSIICPYKLATLISMDSKLEEPLKQCQQAKMCCVHVELIVLCLHSQKKTTKKYIATFLRNCDIYQGVWALK